MDEYLEMHEIITRRIPDEDGWEFSCLSCSYQARYSISHGVRNLEILDNGDLHARHANHPAIVDTTQPSEADNSRFSDEANLDAENWLTPEIRAKLDEITKGLK